MNGTATHELRVRATAVDLWRAITDPELTRQYWYGALNRSTWTPGARWTSESADGELFLDGVILEAEAPRRLVHTFHVVHEPRAAAESPSTLTIEIVPAGNECLLRASHQNLGPATAEYVAGGWEHILAELKKWIEAPQAVGVVD